MTDDIVERLRNPTWTFPESEDISVLDSSAVRAMAEAADEIERLRTENYWLGTAMEAVENALVDAKAAREGS